MGRSMLLLLSGLIFFNAVNATDPAPWLENFRAFRTAVYQGDRARVKQFIHFPIMNYNNEIWYLVYEDNADMVPSSEKIKPFTEKDFDTHYNKIFSKHFINALLKIKTDDLNKTGEVETITFKDGADLSYKLYATLDKKKNTLSLNLSYSKILKNEKGEPEDDMGEYSIVYQFDILPGGQVRFHEVRLAG